MQKQARIALCLELAAEMRRHAATKSKASGAYYSAMRNARVFLLKAVALRAGANLKTLAIYKAERA